MFSNTLHQYNFDEDQWHAIPINIPGRIGHTIDSLQDNTYICFGSEKDGDYPKTSISTIYRSKGNSLALDWNQMTCKPKVPWP
jgi:hypothetical protein